MPPPHRCCALVLCGVYPQPVRYRAGDYMIRYGDIGLWMYIILEGAPPPPSGHAGACPPPRGGRERVRGPGGGEGREGWGMYRVRMVRGVAAFFGGPSRHIDTRLISGGFRDRPYQRWRWHRATISSFFAPRFGRLCTALSPRAVSLTPLSPPQNTTSAPGFGLPPPNAIRPSPPTTNSIPKGLWEPQ